MQSKDFEDLACYIMAENTFFHDGYANAQRDEVNGSIYHQQGRDREVILPDDRKGNYFYLRNEPQMIYEAMPAERLTDSNAQRLSFLDTQLVQLVASVHHADAYRLIETLRNTCMKYGRMNVQPISSIISREQVFIEEMPRLKQEDRLAALQRLKDETIVKLTLRVTKLFVPGSCSGDPCQN